MLTKSRVIGDPSSPQVLARELDCFCSMSMPTRPTPEFLPQDGAHAAGHLDEAGTRLELGVVADQPMSPVLRLLDKAVLLAYAVAVDVLGDASRLGSTAQAAARIA
jgi:hypothetical protein